VCEWRSWSTTSRWSDIDPRKQKETPTTSAGVPCDQTLTRFAGALQGPRTTTNYSATRTLWQAFYGLFRRFERETVEATQIECTAPLAGRMLHFDKLSASDKLSTASRSRSGLRDGIGWDVPLAWQESARRCGSVASTGRGLPSENRCLSKCLRFVRREDPVWIDQESPSGGCPQVRGR